MRRHHPLHSRRTPLTLLSALALLAGACAGGPEPRPSEPPAAPAGTSGPQAGGGADPTPDTPGAASGPDEAWRAQAPQAGPSPELVLPTFERGALPNGLTVLVASRRDLPLVTLSVACQAGSSTDPAGKAGLASLSFVMLTEGAGGRDSIQLDEAFGQLGASVGAGVSPDGGSASTTVLTRNADAAMKLLADVVRRPNLAPKDFARRKEQQLEGIARSLANPGYLGRLAFAEATFGAAHPYGRPSGGTVQSVKGLTLQDVKGFLAQRLGPKACALVAAGDVSLAEAQALAARHLGDWKGGATPPKVPPVPKAPARTRVVLVPKPGLNQTLVLMGRPAIAAGHPDEEALELASTVFGGFFGSRLNMNLREARGYTYGASAGVDARRGVGPLSASSAVRADVTGPAMQEFYGELKGLKQRPITPQELEAAREGVIRSFPGSFDSIESLAGTLASLYFEGQPLDRLARRVKALEGTDLAAVQRAAEAYFQPELMQVVVVGDPGTVRAQVADLGLGPIELAPPPPGAPATPPPGEAAGAQGPSATP